MIDDIKVGDTVGSRFRPGARGTVVGVDKHYALVRWTPNTQGWTLLTYIYKVSSG